MSELYNDAFIRDKMVRKQIRLTIRGSTNNHDKLAIVCIEIPTDCEKYGL